MIHKYQPMEITMNPNFGSPVVDSLTTRVPII